MDRMQEKIVWICVNLEQVMYKQLCVCFFRCVSFFSNILAFVFNVYPGLPFIEITFFIQWNAIIEYVNRMYVLTFKLTYLNNELFFFRSFD